LIKHWLVLELKISEEFGYETDLMVSFIDGSFKKNSYLTRSANAIFDSPEQQPCIINKVPKTIFRILFFKLFQI
jgi:hypothetical protein